MTDDNPTTLSDFDNDSPDDSSDEAAGEILGDDMGVFLDNYGDDSSDGSTEESGDETVEKRVLEAFESEIAPRLVDAGWGFEAAKSVEFEKTDQSLVNHVRNGVAALARVNELIESFGGVPYDASGVRDAVALFTIHDLHKLDRERDSEAAERFDIPRSEVERYVEEFDLLAWADSLELADFHSCAVDHHNSWTANPTTSTRRFNDYRPLIRVADALASQETPETAAASHVTDAITAAYPNAAGVALRSHRLDDVKGVLTNLLSGAVAETLGEAYHRLLLYQDGVVYLVDRDERVPELDDEFVSAVFGALKQNVRGSHAAYQDHRELRDNLAVRSQGFYGINDQEFFYAGPETVLRAVTLYGARDADPSSDPTDSMADAMAGLESHLPFEIERTREPVGLARAVYTVKRSFVDPVLAATDTDQSSLAATCEVFGVDDEVRVGLERAGEELSLTAGGKWDYSYGVGQALLNEGITDDEQLADRVVAGLTELADDWSEIVETERASELKSELTAYVRDTVVVDGQTVDSESEPENPLTDAFEEYPGSRRGKTCVLCNRGTTGTKGDMKAPKSLTTLQAGYSNHIAVDAGKPDKLLTCYPCQVELSLRETGSERREGGRLWMHFVPDYFYTPASWARYDRFVSNFRGEARTELGGLAEAALAVGDSGVDADARLGETTDDPLGSYIASLVDSEYGRSMIETLDQGFDTGSGYGTRTFGYFKPKDNDTEFQFFGVFVALALASYAGLRVAVSESPIPDVRGRDFQSYARIGAGFSQVHDFYGTEVPLSELRSRLDAAAALIRLGYGTDRNDALFAKYLRATRNKPLPGAYLLKRLAQTDDGSDAAFLLEEARVLDEESGTTPATRPSSNPDGPATDTEPTTDT